MVKFSQRLNELMNIKGFRASDVSKITKIPRSTMHHYLHGHYEPKLDKLFLIAKKLNVTPEWLMGYDVPMFRTIQIPHEEMYNLIVLDANGNECNTKPAVLITNEAKNYFYFIAEEKLSNRVLPNDLLLVYRTNNILHNDIVVAKSNNLYTIWRYKNFNGVTVLKNEKKEVVLNDDYEIIGKVVKLVAEL